MNNKLQEFASKCVERGKVCREDIETSFPRLDESELESAEFYSFLYENKVEIEETGFKESFFSDDSLAMYISDITKYDLLTKEETIELSMKKDDDRLAFNKLVNCNLRLVVYLAKYYTGRGVELTDLIQEGNLGLIHAVEKFDYTYGACLSTYASFWIKRYITNCIRDKANLIRIKSNFEKTIGIIIETQRKFKEENAKSPSYEEIATATGLDVELVRLAVNTPKCKESLDKPMGEDQEQTLMDIIPDSEVNSTDREVEMILLKEKIEKCLMELGERDADIMKKRYGLDGRVMTLEEIAKEYGVSRERIRQIEMRSLRKLRNSDLKSYNER